MNFSLNDLCLTGRYMQLPAAGFYELIILPAHQKPVGGLSARSSG